MPRPDTEAQSLAPLDSRLTKRAADAGAETTAPDDEKAQDGRQPSVTDSGVREVAETAFLETDTGELQFERPAPERQRVSEAAWHTVELGEPLATARPPFRKEILLAAMPTSPLTGEGRTVSRSSMNPGPPDAAGGPDSAAEAFAATRLVPPPLQHVPRFAEPSESLTLEAGGHTMTPSPLFDLPPGAAMALGAGGLLLVRTGDQPATAFAGRLDAIRAMGGIASTRVLYRRTRDTDTAEVLGGMGRPIVRISGGLELVLGGRSAHELFLLKLDGDLAFIREDRLFGFAMSLAYESGRVSLDVPGESGRPTGEGVPVVQLRGAGTFVLELTGKLTSLTSAPGRPLLVRREWVIGWFGRLLTRALPPADSPTGQRGLISFSGSGVILLSSG